MVGMKLQRLRHSPVLRGLILGAMLILLLLLASDTFKFVYQGY
jgi:hypothetical protein